MSFDDSTIPFKEEYESFRCSVPLKKVKTTKIKNVCLFTKKKQFFLALRFVAATIPIKFGHFTNRDLNL